MKTRSEATRAECPLDRLVSRATRGQMMGQYASNTQVSSDKSRMEIERTLRRYGADHFGYMTGPGNAVIGFQSGGRRVKFTVPMPDRTSREFTHTATGRPRKNQNAQEQEWEKACRQRWRALALCVKAKLEAVEAGITTFEEEFMAHIVLPDGSTMADQALPYIEAAYTKNSMPPMLSFDG